MATQIKLRRGTAAQWSSANPTLADGEVGFETDTLKFKLGNGSSSWSSLPYAVNKSQIGLGNVDNTSDLDKVISSATQIALNLKANSSDVASSLALKADSSSVYTKSQVDTIASDTLSSANSYADNKAASIVNSAPATLDTLNELATALGNDPNFATTTATLIGTKANASDVSSSLLLKADASSVYTKTQSDSNYEPKNSNIQSHISNSSNPHNVSKAQVGLGLVDNTSDFDKPISSQTQDALDLKVDFVLGKQLSENDFTNDYKTKIDGIQAGATANDTNANLRNRSTHTGNETSLTWNEINTPSVPALGVTTYSKDVGGREMFAQIGKSGVDYSFQPFLGRNKVILWQANGNTTTSTVFGTLTPTNSGTATTRNVATTNFFTWTRRLGHVSSATNNQASGIRAVSAQFGLGPAAGCGGFHFVARFGISDATLVAGARLFVGMTSSTAVLGNADPSTFANIIGVGLDAADTTLQIMHNDAAGTATKINLGASFPESTNTDLYELVLYCASGASLVYYQVINLSTNAIASGQITTNLPAVNTLLAWQLWRHNVNTGQAVGLDIASVYLETDN